ncbi:hypothetical protein [Enemella evansiae]|nr:hypothetical protein [Enemella evansiae]
MIDAAVSVIRPEFRAKRMTIPTQKRAATRNQLMNFIASPHEDL